MTHKLQIVIALTALCLLVKVGSHSTKFKDCGSGSTKVSNVDITPCSTDPCKLFSGKVSTVAVSFGTNAPADNLTAKAFGIIGILNATYPLPNPNACQKSNLTCPLKSNENDVYVMSLPIPGGIPTEVRVLVQLELLASDKTYMCILVDVDVEPPSKIIDKGQEVLDDVQLVEN